MDAFDTQSTTERQILDLRPLGVQDVPVIGHYAYRRAGRGLQRETHQVHFEVTFLAKGVQIYETEGTRTVLRGGDLYLTRPGERHSTAGQPEEKGEAFWIFLRAAQPGQKFLRLDSAASEALQNAFRQGLRASRATTDVTVHLREIYMLWPHRDQPLQAAAIVARAELLALELAKCFQTEPSEELAGPIAKVMELLRAEDRWDVTISDLAQVARLSEARFKVRFKQEVGIPPGEYLMRRRIEKAKLWLRKTQYRVADIARELAFPTSQYFATVFKRYTGKTPQDWRGKKDA